MAAADQVKLRKRLEALLKLPENQVCADCRKRGPRWASANLGIFICIECSGIHRNLGVHISFVRSVNLDSWTKAQVDYMEEWGNGRANVYYEANVPAHVVKPKEGDSVRVVEKYIREKYEHKKYIAKSVPPKNDRSENVEEDDSAHSNRSSKSASGVPAQVITRQRPAATSASSSRKEPAVPVQPPAPAPSLIDFMDMDTSTVTQAPLIPSNASVASQQPDLFGAFTPSTPAPSAPVAATSPFGDFVTAAPAAGGAHATSFGSDQNSLFSAFTAPPAAAAPTPAVISSTAPVLTPTPAAPAPPPKPQASTAAILSLYGSSSSGPGMVAAGPGMGARSSNGLTAPSGPGMGMQAMAHMNPPMPPMMNMYGNAQPVMQGHGMMMMQPPSQQQPVMGQMGNQMGNNVYMGQMPNAMGSMQVGMQGGYPRNILQQAGQGVMGGIPTLQQQQQPQTTSTMGIGAPAGMNAMAAMGATGGFYGSGMMLQQQQQQQPQQQYMMGGQQMQMGMAAHGQQQSSMQQFGYGAQR